MQLVGWLKLTKRMETIHSFVQFLAFWKEASSPFQLIKSYLQGKMMQFAYENYKNTNVYKYIIITITIILNNQG